MTDKVKIHKMILSAMFLGLALVLPFLAGQIQQIGNALCPMHIPVILCGFFCGPFYALAVGFIAPLMRFALFGMPVLIPKGIAMAFELATYGFVAGFLFRILPKRKKYIYVSLVISMLAGRAVWGVARVILYGVGGYEFGWEAFLAGAFINAIPGIILQLVIIPVLVMILMKTGEGHGY